MACNISRVVVIGGQGADAWAERLRRSGLQAGAAPTKDAAAAIAQAWGVDAKEVLFVMAGGTGEGVLQMGITWHDVSPSAAAGGGARSSSPATCDELMRALVQHNQRAQLRAQPIGPATAQEPTAAGPPLVVAYALKASREAQLAAAGLLPLLPQEGVVFMPLTMGVPLGQQGHMDVLLHKASDFLVDDVGQPPPASVAPGALAAATPVPATTTPAYSEAMQRLQREAAAMPHLCVVDPFDCVTRVFDRVGLARILDGLAALRLPGGVRVRAPMWLPVHANQDGSLLAQLQTAGMVPPWIVKPNAACGVPSAHRMALVSAPAALERLLQGPAPAVPLPAVVQQFVNHGGWQHKVYVLGNTVLSVPRASVPDMGSSDGLIPDGALLFDSLKSLPTHVGATAARADAAQPSPPVLQQPTLEAMARWLGDAIGLTLFGFDVVVPASEPDTYVVIDVNYFPNFGAGAGCGGRAGAAVPTALRCVLHNHWHQHRLQRQQQQ